MSPSLLGSVARFARSPQGRLVMQKAKKMAQDPKTRAQIEQVRERLAKRGQRP